MFTYLCENDITFVPMQAFRYLIQTCVAFRVKIISFTDGALKKPASVFLELAIVFETAVP